MNTFKILLRFSNCTGFPRNTITRSIEIISGEDGTTRIFDLRATRSSSEKQVKSRLGSSSRQSTKATTRRMLTGLPNSSINDSGSGGSDSDDNSSGVRSPTSSSSGRSGGGRSTSSSVIIEATAHMTRENVRAPIDRWVWCDDDDYDY